MPVTIYSVGLDEQISCILSQGNVQCKLDFPPALNETCLLLILTMHYLRRGWDCLRLCVGNGFFTISLADNGMSTLFIVCKVRCNLYVEGVTCMQGMIMMILCSETGGSSWFFIVFSPCPPGCQKAIKAMRYDGVCLGLRTLA